MHTLGREEEAALQLEAVRLRFAELRDSIPIVQRLADAEGVTEIQQVDDVVPLLFEHTVFKAYPLSLIDGQRFGELTRWLGKLTTCDLSQADVSSCTGLDEWIDVLDRNTPLLLCHSSGTTGTFSLLPWSKAEFEQRTMLFFGVFAWQEFGEPGDSRQGTPSMDAVYPYFRSGSMAALRANDSIARWIATPPHQFRTAFPGRMSSDVLYLAGWSSSSPR
jgi:hypothetical protein